MAAEGVADEGDPEAHRRYPTDWMVWWVPKGLRAGRSVAVAREPL
jgi:hypothetical protein